MGMLNRVAIAAFALCTAVICINPPALAAKVGPEFRANTFTAGEQASTAIAVLEDGDFVVVWHSDQDGGDDGFGIYGQRYKPNGMRRGKEFQVNSTTANTQINPAVAAAGNGGFVVVWQSFEQDGSGFGIYGQRYKADGTRNGGEFRVNKTTAARQSEAEVARLANGGFVVIWESQDQDGSGSGIYGQRYKPSGLRDGTEFQVHTTTENNQVGSSVAAFNNGGFVVVWASYDTIDAEIRGQRFDATGAKTGNEFRANTFTAGFQESPSVAARGDGFVVVWESAGQDGSGDGVYGQRYNAAGQRAGTEFRINRRTIGFQLVAKVAALDNNGFVVVWASEGHDGDGFGIYGQRFGASGAPVGNEFRANTTTAGSQVDPAIAGLSDGGFVAVWESPDPSGKGIFGQRYSQ